MFRNSELIGLVLKPLTSCKTFSKIEGLYLLFAKGLMKLFENTYRDIGIIILLFACAFGVLIGVPKIRTAFRVYQQEQKRDNVPVSLSADEKKSIEKDIIEIQNAIRASDKKGAKTYAAQYSALGVDFEKLGFLKRALDAYQKSIKEEVDVATYIHIADAYQRMKEYELAEENYRKAIDRDPKNIEYYQRLADMYFYDRGDAFSARGIYLEGLLRADNDIRLMKIFANFLETSGNRHEAYIYWDAILQKDPKNTQIREHLKDFRDIAPK